MNDIATLAKIKRDIAARKAMPDFGPLTSIERLRIINATQKSFSLETVEVLVEALEKAQSKATQQGNIACALFDEVTQLRRYADDKAPELRAQLVEADRELETLRQRIAELEKAATEPVAWTEKCEITNMQATGLYLRGFPDNSQGRDIALYAVPPAMESVKLPDVEKWRKPDEVRAQNAYRVLTVNTLSAAGINVEVASE